MTLNYYSGLILNYWEKQYVWTTKTITRTTKTNKYKEKNIPTPRYGRREFIVDKSECIARGRDIWESPQRI